MPIINFSALFSSMSRAFNCRRHVEVKPVKFPFWRLPLIPQDRIVQMIEDFDDLIQAILLFPLFRRLLKRGNFRIRRIDWKESAYYCKISLFPDNGTPFKIMAYRLGSQLVTDKDRSFEITKDVHVTVHKRMFTTGMTINAYSGNADYRYVLDIIFEAFRVEYFNLSTENNPKSTKRSLLSVSHRYMNLAQKTWLNQSSCSDLTSRELRKLLDHHQRDLLTLTWNVEPDAKYSNPLKVRNLRVDHGSWLTIDNLSTMKCQVLDASDTVFSALELKKFVVLWQKGGFEELKRIQLSSKGGADWGSLTKEMKPIENSPKHEVHRSDGRVAVVYVIGGLFKLNVCS